MTSWDEPEQQGEWEIVAGATHHRYDEGPSGLLDGAVSFAHHSLWLELPTVASWPESLGLLARTRLDVEPATGLVSMALSFQRHVGTGPAEVEVIVRLRTPHGRYPAARSEGRVGPWVLDMPELVVGVTEAEWQGVLEGLRSSFHSHG